MAEVVGRRVAARSSKECRSSSSSSRSSFRRLPQEIGVLVCQCLGPSDVVKLLVAGSRMRDMCLLDEVWRFFCFTRWGGAANLAVYRSPKDLYLDCNGWFPQCRGKQQFQQQRQPHFQVNQLRLHDAPCLTMDLRMTEEEIIAVSEAPRGKTNHQASVHVIDAATLELRERFEVSRATINCCDIGPGLVCLGSDDSKVRLYRRGGTSSLHGCHRSSSSRASGSQPGYQLACEFQCASEVNDLRFAREDFVIAVRTHQNRHPAGLDLIPLERPDDRISFPGGSWATRGKYIHALDGFEEGCSVSGVACSGEHPLTSAFSAMLFDFRKAQPCVADLPVTSARQGHPQGTMLWPLRAGRSPKVYANLLHEDGRRYGQGTIAMVDFRYPATEVCVRFQLPDPVDDFRCFGGNIYAACTQAVEPCQQRLRIFRCNPNKPECPELLSTVVEDYDAGGRSTREDLKVFAICPRGFATSYGEHLSLGMMAEPLHTPRPCVSYV
mmetsp:Transcript_35601/g.65952  ORF Transcript_35601/g.65952 Transcript_35601/m.65952 type:complete len:495 (-) Transcript_35601:95-1579(-)